MSVSRTSSPKAAKKKAQPPSATLASTKLPSSASSNGAVLLLSDDPEVRDELVKLLQAGNYSVVESSEDESPSELAAKVRLDLIIVARSGGDSRLDRRIRRLLKSSDLPPVIVFGAPFEENGGGDDRESPVFVRLSHQASAEDQLRVLEAARKYCEVRRDNQFLRAETERLCFDLLRALGDTTEKLNLRTEEVHRIQSILEDTHARILKAFMRVVPRENPRE